MNEIMGESSNLSGNHINSGAKVTYSSSGKRRVNEITEEPETAFRRPITKRRMNHIADGSPGSSPSEDISYHHQLKRSSSEEEEEDCYEMDQESDMSYSSCEKRKSNDISEEMGNVPSGAEDAYSCGKRKMNELLSESNCSVTSGAEAAFRCPALKRKVNEIIGESAGMVSSDGEVFSCGKRKMNEIVGASGMDASEVEAAYRYASGKRKNNDGESSCMVPSGVNNIKNNNCGNKNNNAGIGPNGGEGISAAVAKVLQGYDWTLVPVATK